MSSTSATSTSSRQRLLLLLHSSLLLFLLASSSSFTIPTFSSSSITTTSSSSSSLFLYAEALTVYVAGEGEFFVSDHTDGTTRYAAMYQTETQRWTSLDKVQAGLEEGGAFVVRSPGDDQAYFGGKFRKAGGKVRNTFAKYDGNRRIWNEVVGGTSNERFGSTVNAIWASPCNSSLVFLAGGFTSVSKVAEEDKGVQSGVKLSNPIAAYRVAQWNTLTEEYSSLGDGLAGAVFGLFFQDNVLYATGTFKTPFGQGTPFLNGIAQYNLRSPTPSWQPLDRGFRPQPEGSRFTRSFGKQLGGIENPSNDDERYIYVVGFFEGVFGLGGKVPGVARWHTPSAQWSGLGDPNEGPTDKGGPPVIEAISVVGGEREGGPARVYIGGSFNCRLSSGETVPNICMWKEEDGKWYPVGTSFNGTDGIVMDLHAVYDPQVGSDVLYAVGEFTFVDARITVRHMAYWTASNNFWFPIGEGGGSDYRISSVALSLPCNPIPLTVTPSRTPSNSPLPVVSEVVTFCKGKTCDDGNLCTVDVCTEAGCIYTPKTCSDGNICTNDFCSAATGQCMFVPIEGCGESLRTCQELTDCGECISAEAVQESEGCTWLQCAPESSLSNSLANFTNFLLSNTSSSTEFAIFTTENITLVFEDPLTGNVTKIPQFSFGSIKVFFATSEDLSRSGAFGATRVTTGQCIPKLLQDKVLENNTPFGFTCEFVENGDDIERCGIIFGETDQLAAKAKTIGASVGVTAAATGGGCGGFAVVLLFYRRKKSKELREAKIASVTRAPDTSDFTAESPVFQDNAGSNVLYHGEV